MSSKRLHYFDNVKFLLITLVVIGHAIDSYAVARHGMARGAFVFIYSFHMPLFIFISGLFVSRERLSASVLKSRVVFFLLMGFAAKLYLQFANVLLGTGVKFRLLGDDGVPWYMFAMAAFYVLTYLLKERKALPVLVFATMMGLFIGYDKSVGDYLYLSRIVVFFPFFWAGVILTPSDVEERTRGILPKAVGAAMVLIFAYVCLFHTDWIYSYRFLFTGRKSFSLVAIEDCSWVNRLQAYMMTCWMIAGILGAFPHGELPVVSVAGERTFQVYFLHRPIVKMYKMYDLLAAIDGLPSPGWLLVFPLAIATSLVLSAKLFQVPFDSLRKALGEEEAA